MADPKDFIKAELRLYKKRQKDLQESKLVFDKQASKLCADRVPYLITSSNPPRMWHKCANKAHPFSTSAGPICDPDVCPLLSD